MANVTNHERLTRIKALLPPHAQAQIARDMKVSKSIVSLVLAGKRKSPRVADLVFQWFLNWSAQRPNVSEVDKALAEQEQRKSL